MLKMYMLIKISFMTENRIIVSITYRVCKKVHIYIEACLLLPYIALYIQLSYHVTPSIYYFHNKY